jgi:hypothetical protein
VSCPFSPPAPLFLLVEVLRPSHHPFGKIRLEFRFDNEERRDRRGEE